jgi:hypothetical protein
MTPEAIERARQESKAMGDVAKTLIQAGMKLVFGSDNGSAGRGFGWYNQMKFENWITMGFTPAEAIVMATRDTAAVMGIDTGMVAAGRSADFIVLDANPLENIANTRRINKVYLRGAEVDRAGMRPGGRRSGAAERGEKRVHADEPEGIPGPRDPRRRGVRRDDRFHGRDSARAAGAVMATLSAYMAAAAARTLPAEVVEAASTISSIRLPR